MYNSLMTHNITIEDIPMSQHSFEKYRKNSPHRHFLSNLYYSLHIARVIFLRLE